MRNDYFVEARAIVGDPYVLVSMIAGRVKMLRSGNRPLIESPGALSVEDIALREIIEGRITHVLGEVVVLDDIVGLGEIVARKRANRASNPPFPTAASHGGVPA